MSARKSAYRCLRIPVHGGASPNAYVPQITVEVKVFWPPGLRHEVRAADTLTRAYTETFNEIMSDYGSRRDR